MGTLQLITTGNQNEKRMLYVKRIDKKASQFEPLYVIFIEVVKETDYDFLENYLRGIPLFAEGTWYAYLVDINDINKHVNARGLWHPAIGAKPPYKWKDYTIHEPFNKGPTISIGKQQKDHRKEMYEKLQSALARGAF